MGKGAWGALIHSWKFGGMLKGKCAEGDELSKAVSSDTGMGSYCKFISDWNLFHSLIIWTRNVFIQTQVYWFAPTCGAVSSRLLMLLIEKLEINPDEIDQGHGRYRLLSPHSDWKQICFFTFVPLTCKYFFDHTETDICSEVCFRIFDDTWYHNDNIFAATRWFGVPSLGKLSTYRAVWQEVVNSTV